MSVLRQVSLPMLVLAVSAQGCFQVTTIIERGGELGVVLDSVPGEYVSIQRPSGCRTAFLPLSGPLLNAVAAAKANQALDAALLKLEGLRHCSVVTTTDSQEKLSKAGLVAPYAQLRRDYELTGLLDEAVIRRMAETLGVDILIVGQLLGLDADLARDSFLAGAVVLSAYDRTTGRLSWTAGHAARARSVDTRYERTRQEAKWGFGDPQVKEEGGHVVGIRSISVAAGLGRMVQGAVERAMGEPKGTKPANAPAPTAAPAAERPASTQAERPTIAEPAKPTGDLQTICAEVCGKVARVSPRLMSANMCQMRCKQSGLTGQTFRNCVQSADSEVALAGCK